VNTIKMPRGDWYLIQVVLADANNPVCDALYNEINKQLEGQEY
jgi:hypothetical protein